MKARIKTTGHSHRGVSLRPSPTQLRIGNSPLAEITRKAKRLLLELWRDICIFALAFGLFAHVYWLFQTDKWWGLAWDIAWVVAYLVTIAYIVFKSQVK